jgi:hypothetical protein
MHNIQPSFASAPVTPIRQFKPQDQKKIALQKMNEARNKAQMQQQMEHQLKCEGIEQSEGKAARASYEKDYEMKLVQEAELRVIKRKELIFGLLGQGICPFMDLEGERQVYLFDHGIDLATVPTTPQQKEFMNLRRNPKLAEKRVKERFIIKCITDDLIAKGEDPLDYMENNKDKTMEIYGMSDKKLDAIATRYQQIVESQGTLSGIKSETPFDVSAAIGLASVKPSTADKTAAKVAAKVEAAKLKAEKKAEQQAVKATAKAEAAKLKAEQKAAKDAAKAEAAQLKAEQIAAKEAAEILTDETVGQLQTDEGTDAMDELPSDIVEESTAISSDDVEKTTTKSTPIGPIAGVVGVGGGGALLFKNMKDKNAAAEEERQKQFRMIMGLEDGDSDEDEDDGTDDEGSIFGSISSLSEAISPKSEVSDTSAIEPPKKRRMGLASVFSKKGNSREIDLNNLVVPGASAPEFSALLAKLLSFGAPGRFPHVKLLPGGTPLEKFELEEAKKLLIESRTSTALTDEVSAEAFASVVNCMIIDIIDLASSTLGEEEKKNKVTVDALNVVMDFMDHAASLFDAVADGVVIEPVTYGGPLKKSKLEKMFTIYASSMMSSLDGGVTQDRIDTLQQVFNINDKRAEGLVQKGMMKNLMTMMKDPEAMKGMEGMEGMEGLEDMMAAMGGGEGGMPGFDPNAEISPDDLKQSVTMMKELIDSGSVSKDELDIVRKQFSDMYGSDINELIKAADDEGGTDALGGDEKELLDLFKSILKEE